MRQILQTVNNYFLPCLIRKNYILFLLILLALATRLGHLLYLNPTDFTDKGGLFLEFCRQISKNNYALPDRIPYYSSDGLPFLYPPLIFFIGSLVIDTFNIAPFVFINLAPPVISLISVICFYFLSIRIFENPKKALLATLIFILIPNAIREQVDTEGLAESAGTLGIVGLGYILHRLYAKPIISIAVVSGVVFGLNVLSSPGGAYGASITGVFFSFLFIVFNKKVSLTKKLCLLAVSVTITVALSSLYLLQIFPHLKLVMDAFNLQTGDGFVWRLIVLLKDFKISSGPPIWSMLCVLGFFYSLRYPRYLIYSLWSILILVMVAREGEWFIAPAAAVTATLGLTLITDLFIPKPTIQDMTMQIHKFVPAIIIAYLILLWPLYTPLKVALGRDTTQIEAMHFWRKGADKTFSWAKSSLKIEDSLIFIGNPILREWAPYFTQKNILNVPEGTELDPYDPQNKKDFISVKEIFSTIIDIETAFVKLFQQFEIPKRLIIMVNTETFKPANRWDEIEYLNKLYQNETFKVYSVEAKNLISSP